MNDAIAANAASLDGSVAAAQQVGTRADAAAEQLGHKWSKRARQLRDSANQLQQFQRQWLVEKWASANLTAAIGAEVPDVGALAGLVVNAAVERTVQDTGLLDQVVHRARGLRLAALQADQERVAKVFAERGNELLEPVRQHASALRGINLTSPQHLADLAPDRFTAAHQVKEALGELEPIVSASEDLATAIGHEPGARLRARLLAGERRHVSAIADGLQRLRHQPLAVCLAIAGEHGPDAVALAGLDRLRVYEAKHAADNARAALRYAQADPGGSASTVEQWEVSVHEADQRVRELESAA